MPARDCSQANPGMRVAQQPRELDPTTSARALFGYQLRQLRTARKLSLDALGQLAHVSGDAIATYEKGRSLPPDQRTVEMLDDALTALGLLTAAWSYARRHADHADSHADKVRSARAAGTMSIVSDSDRDPVIAAARRAAQFGAWAERTGLGPVSIEMLLQQVRSLALDCLRVPPADAALNAALLADEVYRLIRENHRPGPAKQLYGIASQVSGILAWLSGDLGQLDAAALQARTAWACAELAEDPATLAWACVVASKTALWRSDLNGAIDFARRGAAIVAPGTAGVMLACQQADVYSQLGAASEARGAVRDALDAADHQRGVDPVGGLMECGPVRRLNYSSSARLEIGEADDALEDADGALELCAGEPNAGFGTVAQINITRCKAHLAAGRLDAADAALRPVLDLSVPRRLATLTSRLAPLPATLTRSHRLRGREASALAEEIAEFCSRPAAAPALPAGTPEEDLAL